MKIFIFVLAFLGMTPTSSFASNAETSIRAIYARGLTMAKAHFLGGNCGGDDAGWSGIVREPGDVTTDSIASLASDAYMKFGYDAKDEDRIDPKYNKVREVSAIDASLLQPMKDRAEQWDDETGKPKLNTQARNLAFVKLGDLVEQALRDGAKVYAGLIESGEDGDPAFIAVESDRLVVMVSSVGCN